jgi:hypothetical protein
MSNAISTVIPSVEGPVLQVLARTDMPLSGSRIASLIPNVTVEGVRRALHRLVASGLVNAEPVGVGPFWPMLTSHPARTHRPSSGLAT